LALKLGRTVAELLSTISHRELVMWSYFFEEPDADAKNEMQIAQLSSILLNINGIKSSPSDFIWGADTKENNKNESKSEKMRKKLRLKYGRR